MDNIQYEQYTSVILSGQLSLDALNRIIRHDKANGWNTTPGGLARIQVRDDCISGKISLYKLHDEKGDMLYGNMWPLPPEFVANICIGELDTMTNVCVAEDN